MWNKYNKWVSKCYDNMIGVSSDFGVWQKTFEILTENIRETYRQQPDLPRDMETFEYSLEDDCDISGWLEDFLDEMDMHQQYNTLLHACTELLSLFSWEGESDNDLRFDLSMALKELGELEKAESYTRKWYTENPENHVAQAAFIYIKIAQKDYEECEKIAEKYEDVVCDDETDMTFTALEKLFEATHNKKKLKEIRQKMKTYEEELEASFEYPDLDTDEWDLDDDDLPFN